MNNKIKIAIESLGLNPERTMVNAEISNLSEADILEGLAKVYFLKMADFTPREALKIARLANNYHWQSEIGLTPSFRVAVGILGSYLCNRGEEW